MFKGVKQVKFYFEDVAVVALFVIIIGILVFARPSGYYKCEEKADALGKEFVYNSFAGCIIKEY